MYRIDDPSASPTLPVPEAALTEGFWTEGNPATGVPATLERASWFNMIQEELRAIVVAGGLTPSKTTYNQVLTAIRNVGLAQAQAMRMQYSSQGVPASSANLTTAIAGESIIWTGGTGTLTLPDVSTMPNLLTATKVTNEGTGPLTLACEATQTFFGLGSNPASIVLQIGDDLEFNPRSTTTWRLISGAALRQFTPLVIAPAVAANQAVQLGQLGHGQCRLSVASTTSLKLSPYGGNNVIVNGVPVAIPSAGLTIANTSLSASTVYYVYLTGTPAAPALALSTTGHVTGANGIEVKNGDATQTLVGMISTNASSQFVDSATQRFCLNWFNRALKPAFASGTSGNFTNTVGQEINTGLRVAFLTWADEAIFGGCSGIAANTTANATTSVGSVLDGASFSATVTVTVPAANATESYVSQASSYEAEGSHILEIFASVTAGTGSFFATNILTTKG